MTLCDPIESPTLHKTTVRVSFAGIYLQVALTSDWFWVVDMYVWSEDLVVSLIMKISRYLSTNSFWSSSEEMAEQLFYGS